MTNNDYDIKRRRIFIISILVLLLFSIGFTSCITTSKKKSMIKLENMAVSNNPGDKKSTNKSENMTDPKKLGSKMSIDTTTPDNSGDSKSINKSENTAVSNTSEGFDPYKKDGRKVVYLTFDDGPSANNTPKILDILNQYNIKATFFLIGQNAEQNKDLVKREAAQGNVIGNHTYSHDMKYIYSDPKTFMEDIYKCQTVLSSILGENYNLKLVRFPGGSFGVRLKPFREELTGNGYHYVDWNDLNGDAEHNNVPVQNLIHTTKKYAIYDHLVVLMHDAPAKVTTVQALPAIIEYFKSQGYSFETLN
ncbi:MAG TPA: polysaccharide deacetylase [Clostridium sp.]|jgi:peptidoglycan/xylan/chitin deacetylase (PgdA/CDA1 family)|uniref:Polysaccharide deacetylase family protein n=1 Tax=Clostridium lapidicellarium TaxID=3240931 RepID=A0ABV4DZY5_9CLOT|nr:polysaccharide deacetylase [Clostridiales bacterium]HBC97082.1 polysaccharide deacetylase [Clostridium sp.]